MLCPPHVHAGQPTNVPGTDGEGAWLVPHMITTLNAYLQQLQTPGFNAGPLVSDRLGCGVFCTQLSKAAETLDISCPVCCCLQPASVRDKRGIAGGIVGDLRPVLPLPLPAGLCSLPVLGSRLFWTCALLRSAIRLFSVPVSVSFSVSVLDSLPSFHWQKHPDQHHFPHICPQALSSLMPTSGICCSMCCAGMGWQGSEDRSAP